MPPRTTPEDKAAAEWPEAPIVQGEPLQVIRTVERVLTRPDGTQVAVRVPVYPCFRLETWPPNADESRHLGARQCESPRSAEGEDADVDFDSEEDAA